MSEHDLFIACIPMIAEMVVEVRKAGPEAWDKIKTDSLAETSRMHSEMLQFIRKVIIVIDTYLARYAV